MNSNLLRIDIADSPTHPTIRLNGKLTVESVQDLRRACTAVMRNMTAGEITIDLAALDYIDSLSIGMLIKLNEETKLRGVAIVLKNPQTAVMKVFKIVHLDRILTVR